MGTRKLVKSGTTRASKAKRKTGKKKATASRARSAKKARAKAGKKTKSGRAKAATKLPKKAVKAKAKSAANKKVKKTATAKKAVKAKKAAPLKKVAPKKAVAKKKAPKRPVLPRHISTAASQSDSVLPPAPKIPKTRLLAKQLREFKAMLLDKRAQLEGDVQHLTDEALHRGRGRGGSSGSSMPIHMAELGSDNWEREFTLGLAANDRALVREIDDALERIQAKTYGVCLIAHEPISIARLRAKPWAKHCIACARKRDEGRRY